VISSLTTATKSITVTECRAWLDGCGRRWNCGTEYEFQVFQAQPLPPCANPGPFFVPPIQPGQCVFDAELGECAFNGEVECDGGKVYKECGSLCPLTCKGISQPQDLLLCPTVCSAGCFCPDGTVLHNGQCIPPSQCPNANPCDDPNRCGPNQDCELRDVICVKAPCLPVAVCVDSEFQFRYA
jgi:hypothetical protein